LNTPLKKEYIRVNGISLHVVQAGPDNGTPIIFLHGFPEFWYGWRRQIDFFAQSGCRLIIPDQRGYNLSDKPREIEEYHIDRLADDIIGLMDALHLEKVHLVGHDWGGAVAWRIASQYPQRLEKLIILNVPHPSVMQRSLRKSRAQLWKSWYILFFQIPLLPEMLIQRNDWSRAVKALLNSSRPDTFTDNDLERYREAWSRPWAFRSMINWYRVALRVKTKPSRFPLIPVPTLLIWGTEDKFLGREMAEPSIEKCENGQLVFIEGATHWVQHEEPEQVNLLIRNFIENR
jgi:pimeloyl-ACP methyl ester carboxylesterase